MTLLHLVADSPSPPPLVGSVAVLLLLDVTCTVVLVLLDDPSALDESSALDDPSAVEDRSRAAVEDDNSVTAALEDSTTDVDSAVLLDDSNTVDDSIALDDSVYAVLDDRSALENPSDEDSTPLDD